MLNRHGRSTISSRNKVPLIRLDNNADEVFNFLRGYPSNTVLLGKKYNGYPIFFSDYRYLKPKISDKLEKDRQIVPTDIS